MKFLALALCGILCTGSCLAASLLDLPYNQQRLREVKAAAKEKNWYYLVTDNFFILSDCRYRSWVIEYSKTLEAARKLFSKVTAR